MWQSLLILTIGMLAGFWARTVLELLKQIKTAIKETSRQSGVVRTNPNQPVILNPQRKGGIIKPKTPKEVAIENAAAFERENDRSL